MPVYRRGIDRYRKWEAKFVPETVSARFTQVSDIAKERAQFGLNQWATVQDLVRPILDVYGITGPSRALYLGFANKLMMHMLRHGAEAGKKIGNGLKSYYVTAYGADPVILDEIIQVVTGWVIPY
ncbi:MAG: coat protein [Archaeoglobales archaeon]|nr:MAG: coat protein [Archaeoglobales archaeon]